MPTCPTLLSDPRRRALCAAFGGLLLATSAAAQRILPAPVAPPLAVDWRARMRFENHGPSEG